MSHFYPGSQLIIQGLSDVGAGSGQAHPQQSIFRCVEANYIHYKMINIFLCYNGLPAPSLGLIWIRGIESSGFSVIVDKHGESEAEISFCLPSLCWS